VGSDVDGLIELQQGRAPQSDQNAAMNAPSRLAATAITVPTL
jgi:hypothetical protein